MTAALTRMPVEQARRINDQEAAVMFGRVEAVRQIEDRAVAGPGGPIRVRVYRPDGGRRGRPLVYFHGGGWVVGGLDSHDGVARHLCHFGGCAVVAVDYRLAPEHRFPAAFEDAWAVTEWAAGEHAESLFVGGDSAGGTLAAAVAQKARERGPTIGFQLLVYPVLECSAISRSPEYSHWVDQYLRDPSDATRVEASPLRERDLHGLPPALVLSCQGDPLLAQAVEYTQRLRRSGVQVEHVVYPGLIHGAYRMPGVLPAARAMLDASAQALRSA